jgi:circadian clock protein KaiC
VTQRSDSTVPLPRLRTGIDGVDSITRGGLPAGEVTLVGGVTGSGKTVLAMQFLVEGLQQFGEAGVLVTFGERPAKLRRFVGEFGWDVAQWEAEGSWAFVDVTLEPDDSAVVVGERYDLRVLVQRIAAAVERTGATRVALDSLESLFTRFPDMTAVRAALMHLITSLEQLGVTTIATVARSQDYGDLTPHGVEEYLADNIVILRNPLEKEARRRTIEVVKLRGTAHRRGEFPFAITAPHGISVIPLTVEMRQPSTTARTTTGNADLDEMLGGGLFRDSVTLLPGATGIGKTTLALQFVLAGVAAGEPAVFVGFEESTSQLERSIRGWGYDLQDVQDRGLLEIFNDYPEVSSLEEHGVRIKRAIDRVGARRFALDSLTTISRVGSLRGYQEFSIGLTAYLKERRVTGLLTTVQSALWGSPSATDEHISVLSDSIVLLRYVEVAGEVRRGLVVLKHRGSQHDKRVHEFAIEPDGVHVLGPFRTDTELMTGHDAAGRETPPDPRA